MGLDDREIDARQEVWNLLEEHPELTRELSLGNLVAQHRTRADSDSENYWDTNWDAILAHLREHLQTRARD